MRLAWTEFMRRLESSDPNHRITVASFLEQVDTLANNLKEESLDQLLQCPVLPPSDDYVERVPELSSSK